MKQSGCWVAVVVAYLFFTLVCGRASHMDGYYLFQGTGQWQSFLYDEIEDDHAVSFSAYADYRNDCGWLIDIRYENEYVENFVSGTDGENIITVARYKPQYTDVVNGYALVEKATIPRGDSSLPLSAIWLAFSAPCYLDKLDDFLISPPYFKDGNPEHVGYNSLVRFDVTREDPGPGFVTRMHFFHDGKGLTPGRQQMDAPRPFHHGFTNATFTVTRFSQGDMPDWLYPAEFTLAYYYPLPEKQKRRAYRLYPTQRFHGVVTNVVRMTEMPSAFPEAPTRMTYLDRRFMNVATPHLRVNYMSDRYLTDEEVQGLPEFAPALSRQEALRRPMPEGRHQPHGWTMVLIVIVLFAPFALLAFRHIKREGNES